MNTLKETAQLPVKAQKYKEAVWEDSSKYPGGQCKKCRSRNFQKQGQRNRWFITVLNRVAYAFKSALCRWQCTRCDLTFTNYGKLCMPHKRYLRVDIESRSLNYIESEETSYRRVVKEKGFDVVYAGETAGEESSEEEKEREEIRCLSPSTVHRWISGIAACRESFQYIIQEAMHMGMNSVGLIIPCWKYRTAARKHALSACGQILAAVRFIAVRNPTDFATLGSSP